MGATHLDPSWCMELRSRVWELRGRFSCYDAAYVALAEGFGVPLVTCDARLARAAENLVEVRLLQGD